MRIKRIYLTIAIFLFAAILCVQASAATVTYTHDNLNRLTRVDYGNGTTITYTYDAAGNRLTMTAVTDNDTDNDGILDSWEIDKFGNLTTADETTDYDNDGLLDIDEYANNTDPKDTDSDNDGMDDGWEVTYGLDPLIDDSADDKDVDGITNLQEYLDGSDPTVTTPTVASITPSFGTNDGSVDITDLAGINFQDPLTVKLTKAGETDIVATNVSFVNSTRLTCTFNLAGAAPGAWDVEVTIPNGETGKIQNGFTVPFPTPTAGIPSSIIVPSSDSDGNYPVSWGTSSTSSVTYVLQEATDLSFTSGLRTPYSGTGTSATITGRSNGVTYYYRVNATKSGYNDSVWKIGSNGCTVSPPCPTLPADGIMDNGSQWTSSTGTWKPSSGADPYGSGSLYSNTSGTYEYCATGVSGSKEVSLWWTEWSNRCTSVQVDIYDGNTNIATEYVNHKANGGKWNSLGTYPFSGTAKVVINSQGGCTTGADACKIADSGVVPPCPTLPTDGIMDNGSQWASSTGTWKSSSGVDPYGSGSLYSNTSGTYEYCATGVSGSKEVSLWWTEYSNRCTSVPVDIYDGNTLLSTVNVNHKANGGKWNSLGTYSFSGTARVVINSQGGCTTCADAVRIVSSSAVAGVTITESAGRTDVAEEGATSDDYTVVLTSAPTGDVVVTVTSQDKTMGVTVDFTSLTFGTGTWSVPQTVTVTAVDDTVVEGAHSTQIYHAIDQALTQDLEYDAVTGINSVTAKITDNDGGGPFGLPQDGIMDNDTQWTTFTGNWSTSSGASPYGTSSLYANTSATYTYEASGVNGAKEVSLWWTTWSNRCTSVQVDIYDGSTNIATKYVNHKANGGKWNSLGTYTFSGTAKVIINSQGSCTTGADACKIADPVQVTCPTLPADGIMDNGSQWASSTGTWKSSSGVDPYGSGSLYSNTSGTYEYCASGVNGSREVSLWWTTWSNRCTSVQVDIYDSSTNIATKYVNHKANGGKWNYLGTYTFSGTARVVINSQGGCTTCADALRITP